MTRRLPLALLVALLMAGGWALYMAMWSPGAGPLSISVRAVMGDEALRFGQASYENPGGEGEFSIRDYQFFLSNVRLVAEDAEYRQPESYHLVRFDSDDGVFRIDLGELRGEDWTYLEFGIGVDSAANASYAPLGDLDPNGRMAWGWEIGYKFVLVEGGLDLGDVRIPLVYHVGFDENYRQVSIPVNALELGREDPTIDLCADLLALFAGRRMIDMSQLSNVTFEEADSRVLADNYGGMVSSCPPR